MFDPKASRGADREDISAHDVPLPASTDPAKLAAQIAGGRRAKGLTVVFCTYQSLPVVARAHELGLEPFDLVVCDEAHRTTGVTLVGNEESNFVRVHDAGYIRGGKRLYMTATPRIFADEVKGKADEHSAVLTSMDDEAVYGPELHRLSFGQAVAERLLTDYKVLVLTRSSRPGGNWVTCTLTTRRSSRTRCRSTTAPRSATTILSSTASPR